MYTIYRAGPVQAVQTTLIYEVADMIMDAFKFSGLGEIYTASPEKARQYVRTMMINPDCLLSVAVDNETNDVAGVLLANSYPALLGNGIAAHEQLIWVAPQYRNGRILTMFLKEFEEWSEELKADIMFMVSHEEHTRFEKIYARHGYKPSDRVYVKGN